jgi:hypothetical protein
VSKVGAIVTSKATCQVAEAMTTADAAHHYADALERLAELNAEARALAEVLDYFAGLLRGARPDPDGPPLEALPSAYRVRRLLDRRFEAAGQVEDEWDRLPADVRETAPAPEDLLA